jgi:hypothetical protein
MTDQHFGPDAEDFLQCPVDLVDHLAEVEAGWTLPKWWKATDEDRALLENRQSVREMLERWERHGITVRHVDTP